jgi:hypothetical protein
VIEEEEERGSVLLMREKGNRKFRIQDQKYANMEEIKPKNTAVLQQS